METYFENTNILDENMLVEIYRKLTIVYRIIAICGLVVAALFLCAFFAQLILEYEIVVDELLPAIIWLAVAYMGFSAPKKLAKKMMKSSLTRSNGHPIVQKGSLLNVLSHAHPTAQMFLTIPRSKRYIP